MEKSEVEKFFDELPASESALASIEEKPVVEQTPALEDSEDDPESPKNRRERRLVAKIERERAGSIAVTEKLRETTTELEKFKSAVSSGTDDRLKEIFGDDEKGKLLTKHFSELFSESETRAYQKALNEIESRSTMEQQQEQAYGEEIDDEFDSIEDKYGVDLSSDSSKSVKLRNDFIDFMLAISPKDENGDISEYADFDAGFDAFSRTRVKAETRNKELAARTMTDSHSPSSPSANDDATERWLNENGIKTRLGRR